MFLWRSIRSHLCFSIVYWNIMINFILAVSGYKINLPPSQRETRCLVLFTVEAILNCHWSDVSWTAVVAKIQIHAQNTRSFVDFNATTLWTLEVNMFTRGFASREVTITLQPYAHPSLILHWNKNLPSISCLQCVFWVQVVSILERKNHALCLCKYVTKIAKVNLVHPPLSMKIITFNVTATETMTYITLVSCL